MGKQLEGGVKYQFPGTSVLLTAAGFHIEQTNVLVAVGNLGYNVQSGKVHSDGFEFEAHAQPYKNLMITAAVSVQKVKDDSTGKPLMQSGKGNASLFAYYTMPKGVMKGFGFGGGLRYSAPSYGGRPPTAVCMCRNIQCLMAPSGMICPTFLPPCVGGAWRPACATCLIKSISATAWPMPLTGRNGAIMESAEMPRAALALSGKPKFL